MAFAGFQKETVRFLTGLRAHNETAWFDAHRGVTKSRIGRRHT